MTVTVQINSGFEKQGHAAVIEWYKVFAAELLREAQAVAAEKISGGTGAYERSFAFELIPGDPPRLLFGNTSSHAIYLEEDTVAHDIRPVNKKALRWFSPPGGGEGAAVFSQFAHIPARKGQHIIREALLRVGTKLR